MPVGGYKQNLPTRIVSRKQKVSLESNRISHADSESSIIKVVTAAIAIKDKKILVAKRAPGQKHAGFWEFPGGKLEPGESTLHCMERELFEEFGVQAQAIEEIGFTDYVLENGSIRLIAVRVKLPELPLALTVHSEVDWLTLDRLNSIKLLPADIELIGVIEPFFHD
jgi:8-oxo-dGTP diphosphatase